MIKHDPTSDEYLAVVSEWSSYGQQSASRVGNVYPVFNISRDEIVKEPVEEFPNPGYVFLVNRGELAAWDYVSLRPSQNIRYKHSNPRECYYIARTIPQVLDGSPPNSRFAIMLDVGNFQPSDYGNLIRNPSQNVTPVFFVRTPKALIYGPLRRLRVTRTSYDTLETIQWGPHREDSVIYEFTVESLTKQGCRVETYEHPEVDLNEVVRRPINLVVGPVLTAISEKSFDRLSEDQLAEWYLRLKDVQEVSEDLLKTLRTAPESFADTTSDVIRQRCWRMAKVFTKLDAFQTGRHLVVRQFLETEDGKNLLKQQLAQEVERKAQSIQEEVNQRQKELSDVKKDLEDQLSRTREDHDLAKKKLTLELANLQAQQEELAEKLRSNLDELGDKVREQIPLLAALAPGFHMSVAGNSTPLVDSKPRPSPTWGAVAIPAPTKDLDEAAEELALVGQLAADLAREQLSFTRDFLANLYICLKSSGLNLIMGPPGHGKSSVVGAMTRSLGHGNALLEIAVRRSWADDRHLLGFFDTFHGRYDPGPTGLATRLLQAQLDWEKDRAGLYVVLLDEFNLAAPEYYFSQLLQLVTRPHEQRVLQLFDPAALPPGAGPAIHRLPLYPNVSFWGTINYDETTERLSPRLLDRTGMIFLTARDVLPSLTLTEASRRGASKGVSAGRLYQFTRPPDQVPEEHWDILQPLLDLLKKQTEDWGPGIDLSPRVIDGVKRYLANSVALLPPARAVDFVFQQRVLPTMRGRDPKFVARMEALVAKLNEKSLARSARQVRDALALASVHFGDVDFLAY